MKKSCLSLLVICILSVLPITPCQSSEFFRGQTNESETLKEIFTGLPQAMLVKRLVDDNGRKGDEAQPSLKKLGNGLVVCAWNVEIYFHLEKYYSQWVPRLLTALESLGPEGGTPVTTARNTPRHKEEKGQALYAVTPFHNYAVRFGDIDEGIKPLSDNLSVLVNVGRDKWGTNQRFKIFSLDKEKHLEMFESLVFPFPLTLKIVLETVDQRVIREDYLDCDYSLILDKKPDTKSKIPVNGTRRDLASYGNKSNAYLMFYDRSHLISIISPEFLLGYENSIPIFDGAGKHKTYISDDILADTLMVRYEVTMSEDDLSQLGKVRLDWK